MTNSVIIPAALLKDPRHFLSLGFGSGLARKAPGTFGTIAAIPPYLLLADIGLVPWMIIITVGFVVGIYLCQFTSDALGVHDHSGIVWDEFIGFWMTMMVAPSSCWQWVLAGFILFRIFDIIKPWPIKLADTRIHGGFGIMVDDVLAAIYAIGGMLLLDYSGLINCP